MGTISSSSGKHRAFLCQFPSPHKSPSFTAIPPLKTISSSQQFPPRNNFLLATISSSQQFPPHNNSLLTTIPLP